AEAAYLWVTEPLLPTRGSDPRVAFLSAAAGKSGDLGQHLCATHAESADGDECAVGECDQRHHRSHRDGHFASPGCRRTEPTQAGPVEAQTACHPRGDCAKSGRQLARGTDFCFTAEPGSLRLP